MGSLFYQFSPTNIFFWKDDFLIVHLMKPPDISLQQWEVNAQFWAFSCWAEVSPVLATSGAGPGTEHWWWGAPAAWSNRKGPWQVMRWQKVMSGGHPVPAPHPCPAWVGILSKYERLQGKVALELCQHQSREINHFYKGDPDYLSVILFIYKLVDWPTQQIHSFWFWIYQLTKTKDMIASWSACTS